MRSIPEILAEELGQKLEYIENVEIGRASCRERV